MPSGDDELVDFCRREHPRLVGLLGLYCGDVPTAEDLAQEALLRVCRAWPKVRTFESPEGWVRRVAINLAISRHRRARAGASATGRMQALARVPQHFDLTDALTIRAAVASLPEQQRRALVLRYYADLSVAETAEEMGCPEGTVKTLTSRAVQALRRLGWEVHD